MANYISFVNFAHLGRDHLPSLFGRLNKKVTSLATKDAVLEEEKPSIIYEIVKHAEKKEASSEGSVYDSFGSKSNIPLKIVDSRGDYIDNALLVESPEQLENAKCPKRSGISVRFIQIFGRLTGCLFRRNHNAHENDVDNSKHQINKENKSLEKSERETEKQRKWQEKKDERKLEKQNRKQLKRIEKEEKKQRKLEKKVEIKTRAAKKEECDMTDEYVNEKKSVKPMFEVVKNSSGFGLKDLNEFEVSEEDLAEAGSSKQTFQKCSQCYGSTSQQSLDKPSTSSGIYHSTSLPENRMYFTNMYSC